MQNGVLSIVSGAWQAAVNHVVEHPFPGGVLDDWVREQDVFDAQTARQLKAAAKQFKVVASKDKAAFCHEKLAASWSEDKSAGLYKQLRPLGASIGLHFLRPHAAQQPNISRRDKACFAAAFCRG